MKTAVGSLLIFHLLADFYFQPDWLARKKESSLRYLITHCLIYALVVGIGLSWLYCLSTSGLLASIAALAVSHVAIDGMLRKPMKEVLSPALAFALDQGLHLVVLTLVFLTVAATNGDAAILGLDEAVLGWSVEITWVLGILMSCLPGSVVVSKILDSSRDNSEASNISKIHSGKWIGILERLIVLALTLQGQYSAIAFVFTAKSIARFKEIESSRDFAEVYLLGTLTSVAIAMFSGMLAAYLLA